MAPRCRREPAVPSTPPQRIAALSLFILVAIAGVAGMMQPVQEQVPASSPPPEPENLPAMHSPERMRPVPNYQASALAGTATQPAEAEASSKEGALQSGSQEMSTLSSSVPQSAPVSLPPPHLEISADGLPANGLRCTYDGGVFHCGDCRLDSDCPAGKGCIANRETRRFECMESECEEDAHCFPGFVCRSASRGSTGPIIRRCMPVGQRREGEPCDSSFVSTAGACQEGLICHRAVCSAPCRLEDAASCPQGYACEEAENGAACFPDCRVRGCPGGQQCKRLNNGDVQCLEQVHGECPETPCAEGERCNMRVLRGRGVFWCARLCNPLRADSCPADQICGVGGGEFSTCYRRCDPMDLDSCGEGERCTTISEDMLQWGCMPIASAH
jgi:hypothetical protein